MRIFAHMLLLAGVLSAHAASTALIVVGLTASETDDALWQKLAGQARTGLVARGIAPENITTLTSATGQPVTRDNILAALAKAHAATGTNDDFWLLLLGHTAPGRDGNPAFQVRGPRLGATDLRNALAAFPGATNVLLGTELSTDYLPLLKSLANCTAVAASAGPETPRFPEFWVESLNTNPHATFSELAATTADRVDAYYKQESLARGENAALLADQAIQDAPFTAVESASPSAIPGAGAPSAADALTTLQFPPPTPPTNDKDFTQQPANDQSRALLAAAQKVAAASGDFSAVILHQELDLTFNADRTTTQTTRLRVYLRNAEAIDTWADYDFVDQPPMQSTVIESARVIRPDGSILVANPDRLAGPPPPNDSEMPLPFHVHLPQVQVGGIVEIAWRVEYAAEGDLPETYAEFPLANQIPVADTLLTLRTPKNLPVFHQFRQLPNPPAPVESVTEHSSVLTWHLPAIPAWEPLPNDPPTRDLVPMLAVSSFASWDAFADWFRSLTQGNFDAGPATKAAAAEIARAQTTPAARLHAAYEEVSNLRYVALEIGIHGFRPRPPDTVLADRFGDCKDKATLLAALLRELGIPADFALLNRGSSTDVSFPGWQFNHALVHVPASADLPEQWLDATDGTTPFGFIAPGDLGRSALVFSGNQSSFITITDSSHATTVTDSWTLAQLPDGSWHGQFERRFTGLADEEMRDQLRPLSPAQRNHALQSYLARLSNDVEYSNMTVSDLSNLDAPVTVNVQVNGPAFIQPFGPDHPVAFSPAFPPGLDLVEELAAPERDRPFLVNDGQPLKYAQQVRLAFNQPLSLAAAQVQSSGPHAVSTITYTRPDPATVLRATTLDITSPVVPAADYAAFRRAILDWRRALAAPFSLSHS